MLAVGLIGLFFILPATLVAWGFMDGWARAKRALWKQHHGAAGGGEAARRSIQMQFIIAVAGAVGGIAWYTRHGWFYRYAGGSSLIENALFIGLALALFAAGSTTAAIIGVIVIRGSRILEAVARRVLRRCVRAFTRPSA